MLGAEEDADHIHLVIVVITCSRVMT